MKNLKNVFIKFVTVIVDRRFWVALLTILGMLLGVPEMVNSSEHLGAEMAEQFKLIIQSVGIIFTVVSLLFSWAIRAPSGLEPDTLVIKKLSDHLETLLTTLKETK